MDDKKRNGGGFWKENQLKYYDDVGCIHFSHWYNSPVWFVQDIIWLIVSKNCMEWISEHKKTKALQSFREYEMVTTLNYARLIIDMKQTNWSSALKIAVHMKNHINILFKCKLSSVISCQFKQIKLPWTMEWSNTFRNSMREKYKSNINHRHTCKQRSKSEQSVHLTRAPEQSARQTSQWYFMP